MIASVCNRHLHSLTFTRRACVSHRVLFAVITMVHDVGFHLHHVHLAHSAFGGMLIGHVAMGAGEDGLLLAHIHFGLGCLGERRCERKQHDDNKAKSLC